MVLERRCPNCGEVVRFDTTLFQTYPNSRVQFNCVSCWSKLVVYMCEFYTYELQLVPEDTEPDRYELLRAVRQMNDEFCTMKFEKIVFDAIGSCTVKVENLSDEHLKTIIYCMSKKQQSLLQ